MIRQSLLICFSFCFHFKSFPQLFKNLSLNILNMKHQKSKEILWMVGGICQLGFIRVSCRFVLLGTPWWIFRAFFCKLSYSARGGCSNPSLECISPASWHCGSKVGRQLRGLRTTYTLPILPSLVPASPSLGSFCFILIREQPSVFSSIREEYWLWQMGARIWDLIS